MPHMLPIFRRESLHLLLFCQALPWDVPAHGLLGFTLPITGCLGEEKDSRTAENRPFQSLPSPPLPPGESLPSLCEKRSSYTGRDKDTFTGTRWGKPRGDNAPFQQLTTLGTDNVLCGATVSGSWVRNAVGRHTASILELQAAALICQNPAALGATRNDLGNGTRSTVK